MKIICAGFPKTGTKSLHEALKILGFSVYDYTENMFLLGSKWQRILDHGWTPEDFKEMYDGVDATCDLPASYFWYELHQSFPDAKIILTTRASEEIWLSSVRKQMEVIGNNKFVKIAPLLSPTFRRIFRAQQSLERVVFGISQAQWMEEGINASLLKKKYREHNACVIQTAPLEQLLQYQVEEGWEPLCKFLNVPVPDCPYPHKNKGGDLLEENMSTDPMLLQIKSEILTSFGAFSTIFVAGGLLLMRNKVPVVDLLTSLLSYLSTSAL